MDHKKKEETFSELVERESRSLFAFLYWALGRKEDAQDALQETFIRVHRGLDDLRDRSTIKRWVMRIATNVAHDIRLDRAKDVPTYGLNAEESAPVVVQRAQERTPEREIGDRETSERLARALAKLPPELREPLVLHAVNGLKYREVAEALGWPIGTVTSRIHAARLQLQEELGEDLDGA